MLPKTAVCRILFPHHLFKKKNYPDFFISLWLIIPINLDKWGSTAFYYTSNIPWPSWVIIREHYILQVEVLKGCKYDHLKNVICISLNYAIHD